MQPRCLRSVTSSATLLRSVPRMSFSRIAALLPRAAGKAVPTPTFLGGSLQNISTRQISTSTLVEAARQSGQLPHQIFSPSLNRVWWALRVLCGVLSCAYQVEPYLNWEQGSLHACLILIGGRHLRWVCSDFYNDRSCTPSPHAEALLCLWYMVVYDYWSVASGFSRS